MVLWEITLGTAYFLGLKRTYRLALRIQRRIVSPKYPKIRQFLHRRTRAVFDVAIRVHRSIQERDIEVGRNFGNFILRWLDRMKPSAQIRPPSNGGSRGESVAKNAAPGTSNNNNKSSGNSGMFKRDSGRHFFISSRTGPFRTAARTMPPPNPVGTTTIHGRHLSFYSPEAVRSNYRVNWSGGVIRKDILQWMLHN
ncbi:uncharacterized protein LOC113869758 [Abrus precatorius]|uniref:Uncharacterized protein LOC113869758 n=1 Tax=Abrus precatorius TaxID=3816 RepID=A0A8B8M273_ABRPR|nr:uncharacterized protein LOC113869758 [Abrus precatorius]